MDIKDVYSRFPHNKGNKCGKYQKFVYFQRFDEFFPQIEFFYSNQKLVYLYRFDDEISEMWIFAPVRVIYVIKKKKEV